YEWNLLQEAAVYLEQSIQASESGYYTRLLVWGLVPYARLLQAEGNTDAAQAAIQRAAQIVREYGLPPFYSAQVSNCQVRIWLAQGTPTAASHWARLRGLT